MTALALSGALVLAACGKGDSADTAAPAEDGVRTDVGVTADTITLGVMTDNSGPFKDLGLGIVHGHEMWREDINAAGGVCDRDIEFVIRDHGYKADQAKIQFPEVESQSVGMLQLLGSPVIAALGQDLISQEITTLAVSWSSELLSNEYVIIAGATYDLEQINGLSYLMDEGMISDGDTLGAIYIEGEYGSNGLRGVEYFAEQHDLDLKTAKVTSTDADMTGIVTGFRGDGVKAISLTTSPTQTASAASANKALGLNVPLIGNNPVFAPVLLDGPAAPSLNKLYVAASSVPFSSDVPKAEEISAQYVEKYTEVPNAGVPLGYALGEMWGQILEKACGSKDMTREGIQAAYRASDNITTDNLIADLDFSNPGSPSAREVYVAVADQDEAGGLRQVKPLFVSEDAKTYVAPHEEE